MYIPCLKWIRFEKMSVEFFLLYLIKLILLLSKTPENFVGYRSKASIVSWVIFFFDIVHRTIELHCTQVYVSSLWNWCCVSHSPFVITYKVFDICDTLFTGPFCFINGNWNIIFSPFILQILYFDFQSKNWFKISGDVKTISFTSTLMVCNSIAIT